MKYLRAAIAVLLLAFAANASAANPPVPAGTPAPLLFVRIAGPAGMRAAFFEPGGPARAIEAPGVFGLRPGYIYRMELSGLPRGPESSGAPISIFPTLEVRGSIVLGPGGNAAQFPVPLVFSPEELTRVREGGFVTKVYYVERPDDALAIATSPTLPLEFDVPPTRDLLTEARERGRVLLILRYGEAQASPEELVAHAVAGTVLFPGESVLPPPGAPPCIPSATWPVYDPTRGPRIPDEEILHDGGYAGRRVGITPDGVLHGLDPSDTVAQYRDCCGQLHVTPSNRVCLYSPRFGATRTILLPAGYESVSALGSSQTALAQEMVKARIPSQETIQSEVVEQMRGREKPSAAQATQGVVTTERLQGTTVASGRMAGADVTGVCQPKGGGPPKLYLCKTADQQEVKVGDVVNFQLSYTNRGAQPITDIVVTDSLTGRLEYVPGSAKADRPQVFSTQANEAGSMILRWEIAGTLLPGQMGLLSFQARVR